VIDDTHHRRVHRRLGWIKRERCFTAADEEHVLPDTGARRVGGDNCATHCLALVIERLEDEQFEPGERLVLPRRDDIADDPRDLHQPLTST
jgi:hypothetical protein